MNYEAHVARYLSEHPLTSTLVLTEALGCNRRHVTLALRALRDEGLVHIAAWERTQSQPRPLYSPGTDRDAPRPTAHTQAERNHRARGKSLPAEVLECRLVACRTRLQVNQREAALRFDPWTNMIRSLK